MKANSKENSNKASKAKKATHPAGQPKWHQMNRKKRRERPCAPEGVKISSCLPLLLLW